MPKDVAIIACDGALPVELAAACPDAGVYTLEGVPSRLRPRSKEHRLEKIGSLFEAMKADGRKQVVFAGSLVRPQLDPEKFDQTMQAIAPELFQAIGLGDDALLRTVIKIFEEQGFIIVGASELAPELVADNGLKIGPEPSLQELTDIQRAGEILSGLSPLDVGQGCVVALGQCLGIETVQGTDALLNFVAATPEKYRRNYKGVFVKSAKKDQDLRIDMPAIGPQTIRSVSDAGLAGLVVEAGRVMILEREKTLQAVRDLGLFLIAKDL